MGSRDRPGKEAKKKPKAKTAQPSLSPMSEPPQNVEVIRKPRKERHVVEDEAEEGSSTGRPPEARSGGGPSGSDEERDGQMAMTDERSAERATAERGKAVDAALSTIEKQFGRGAILKLGSRDKLVLDTIPTGSIALDLALGVGGIPRGRITEIFGPESSGKTTVCQHVIAEAQRRGGVAAFIDVEHALARASARACGVNVDELLVSQPDT